MKMIKFYKLSSTVVAVIVLAIGLVSGCGNKGDQKSGQTGPSGKVPVEKMSVPEKRGEDGTKVVAYYFYTNFRCKSCLTIEKYTKEAIEENFEDELSSEKLVFKTINIEEEDNKHFVDDYQLYTKSVVLSLVKDGEEIKFKDLRKVWELLRNKDEFYKYIEEETKGFFDEINQEKEQ
jgi:hypothetical protein